MNGPRLELVAAVARNGVIGRGGQLPWHLPDDLRHFKELTLGHPILMGRKTFESIGRPLPGRTSVVVSRTLQAPPHPQALLAGSLEEAMDLLGDSAARAFVIGGAALYAAALPRAAVLHLTELDEAVEGDVLFPPFDRSAWRLARTQRHEPDARHPMGFGFCTYERAPADENRK